MSSRMERIERLLAAISETAIGDVTPRMVEQMLELRGNLLTLVVPIRVTVEPSDGRKIPVIKAIRSVLGLGLKEAKELTEGRGIDVNVEQRNSLILEVEAAGGRVVKA